MVAGEPEKKTRIQKSIKVHGGEFGFLPSALPGLNSKALAQNSEVFIGCRQKAFQEKPFLSDLGGWGHRETIPFNFGFLFSVSCPSLHAIP